MNGSRKPPRQQSTCSPMPQALAMAPSASIGSMVPVGYCGYVREKVAKKRFREGGGDACRLGA
eukprot:2095797-Pleurochrysis_carterae.AAC.1